MRKSLGHPLVELLNTSEFNSLKEIAAGSKRSISPGHIGVLLHLKLIEEGARRLCLTAAGARCVNSKLAEP
jgi:hypothetical protein